MFAKPSKSTCNDRELACFERLQMSSKTSKTCVLCTAELPLSSPDTHSEKPGNITKTPFYLNFNSLLTKTRFINWIYTGLEK